jgi:hypothetical protein
VHEQVAQVAHVPRKACWFRCAQNTTSRLPACVPEPSRKAPTLCAYQPLTQMSATRSAPHPDDRV